MFTNALEVEANMMACRNIKLRVEVDKRKGREEIHPTSSTSSSSDVKFEMMLKTMEKLMDRLTVEAQPVNREQNESQIRNPNFRRPIPPSLQPNRQRNVRNPRNQEDQKIRPPFPKNYLVFEDDAESIEDHIHHLGDLDSEIYLTKEEHNMFAQVDDNAMVEELEQYHKGYMHAIDDFRNIKLRSRHISINKGGLNPNQPSSSQTIP